MHFFRVGWLAILLGCAAHGADDGALATSHVAQFSAMPSCHCEPAPGGANPTFDCVARALPPEGQLCQVGPRGLHCAPPGESTQMFIGEVACDPGFCISTDRKRCLVSCGCQP